MKSEPHPINGFVYEDTGEGIIRVENPINKKYGLFRPDGTWLEGDITHADLHFLHYIGGADVPREYPPASRAMDILGGHIPSEMPRTVAMYKPDPGMETVLGARSAGHVDLAHVLDNDRKPERVPDVYRLESPMTGGPTRIPTDRFIKREYHELEVERMWSRVWQMACHVDDLPEVGDYHVYNVASLSFIIVRAGENEFKAHQNVCLHRGRLLCDRDGKSAREFRCPFHGWTWNLDGSLKHLVSEWDFPGVRDDVSRLPAAKITTWGGFVFINPDPDAMSFEEYMGPIAIAHYENFDLPQRYKSAHATKIMPANWKIAMEAFMEAWHVIATHPQLLLMGVDFGNGRYDVWGHWGRGGHVTASASSPQRGIFGTDDKALEVFQALADDSREYLRRVIGEKVDKYSDAELNDLTFNDLFPNLHPWGGFAEIVFRFRPNGDNHEECIMDVILVAPCAGDKPKPPAAQQHFLGDDEPWAKAPGLGMLGRILDQDVGNMTQLQAGLKAKQPPYIWYSQYQEGKIRNFHRNYERWLGLASSFSE